MAEDEQLRIQRSLIFASLLRSIGAVLSMEAMIYSVSLSLQS